MERLKIYIMAKILNFSVFTERFHGFFLKIGIPRWSCILAWNVFFYPPALQPDFAAAKLKCLCSETATLERLLPTSVYCIQNSTLKFHTM